MAALDAERWLAARHHGQSTAAVRRASAQREQPDCGNRINGVNHGHEYDERAEARPAASRSASRCGCKAGFAPAAIPRAASASSSSTTARAQATSRSSPTATLANYESEIKQLARRLQRHRRRRSSRHRPAKGQATEVQAERDRRPRLGRSGNLSAAEERATRSSSCARSPICGRAPTRSAPSPACATASAARSTISSRSRAFSTSTRRSSRPATAKGPARCSRSRRSTWPSCRARDGQVDYTQGFLPRPAYLTVSGQLRPRSSPARWARSTPSGRRSGPRTPTRRGTWPSSGWSSRRWPSSSWPTTCDWPRRS